MIEVQFIPAFGDNYIYLLRDGAGMVAVVDPGDAAPVLAALELHREQLTHILCTHHHGDHVGGVLDLRLRFGAEVVGPAADRDRIPAIDTAVRDGDSFRLGSAEVRVFDTPGHTRGHIAFWLPEAQALFAGDTLFSIGCGRLFEGTPAQMWNSLLKLRALPDEARLYCGHEYTESNLRFALSVDPANPALLRRRDEVAALRAQGEPSLPARLGDEKAANPFLRADDPDLGDRLGLGGADPVAVFAELRGRKDRF